MNLFGLVLSAYGLWLLLSRMWPRTTVAAGDLISLPTVSIIIPARNEAHNLPTLLSSLENLAHDKKRMEIIVIDDESDDGTDAIARQYDCKLIQGEPRPNGWSGKQWACHQASQQAIGDYLVFTDADTCHSPEGLTKILSFMQSSGANMASAIPYQLSKTWWEFITGPFHLLLMAITAPFAPPRPKRVYAVGQYLVFQRQAYEAIGGHESVSNSFVEDIPLANRALELGLTYRLYPKPEIFQVRMYEKLGDFFRGWRRNFRAGMKASSPLAPAEITAMLACLFSSFHLANNPLWAIPGIIAIIFILTKQQHYGQFSWLGAIAFPFSVVLFCTVSLAAVFDMIFRRHQTWKGRLFLPEESKS